MKDIALKTTIKNEGYLRYNRLISFFRCLHTYDNIAEEILLLWYDWMNLFPRWCMQQQQSGLRLLLFVTSDGDPGEYQHGGRGEGCVDILVHGFRCHQIVFPIRDKEGFYLFTKHDTFLISPPSTALSSYRVSCWWLGRTPMLWLLTSLQMLSQGLSSCLLGPPSLVKTLLSPSLIGSSWGWQHCKCCPCKLGLHCWEFWVNTDWFALWGCGPKILVRCPEHKNHISILFNEITKTREIPTIDKRWNEKDSVSKILSYF